MLDINVYDMLVFEDETGSIYQDCVCSITKEKSFNKPEEIEYRLNGSVFKNNKLTVFYYKFDDHICDYVWRRDSNNSYKLKEVWTRTDEDTYKKKYVWSDEFKQLIPYRKGYVKSPNKIEVNI